MGVVNYVQFKTLDKTAVYVNPAAVACVEEQAPGGPSSWIAFPGGYKLSIAGTAADVAKKIESA
jgi:hypothetical protein